MEMLQIRVLRTKLIRSRSRSMLALIGLEQRLVGQAKVNEKTKENNN